MNPPVTDLTPIDKTVQTICQQVQRLLPAGSGQPRAWADVSAAPMAAVVPSGAGSGVACWCTALPTSLQEG
ncbi:MAG: hypothetical protein HEQ17_03225 [Limnohabitans sp.]|uniref:hypothetical protein n=1 Tax=Limnohabitans sp. TaxID=1907725 RepID=UPI0025E8C6CA|nr:hypothetical protein [Limnohabitans sp.]MCO4088005.1 hypothetical protein [Limnohabitans sp.]